MKSLKESRFNWREHNMLGKRLVLIFTKTLLKPRRILVKHYNTHFPASYGYTRHMSERTHAFLHEISFICENIARFLCMRTYGDSKG